MSSPFRVSLVVPVFNEESCVDQLIARTTAVLDSIPGGPHEFILIDDGSRDRTGEMLEAAAARDERIVAIRFSRNFGHQPALIAGLDYATGDAVAILDGDLQDPPEAIPQLLEKFHEGYDVVYVERRDRKESWLLRLCYWVFYRMLAKLSDIKLPLDAGDFGLMSRRVVEELRNMTEHHRYLRGLRSWVGFRQIGVPVERVERASGKSKYSLWGLIKLATDGLVAFSTVPLRAAMVVGLFAIAAAIGFSAYSTVLRITGNPPRGFTALTVLITFLSGVNLFFLGIIGEYVGRIYEESKARPLYVVSHVVNARGAPPALARAASAGQPAGVR